MKKYKNYYWLLDQRFDFLIPWFQTYFGIEDRKDITFVGSFHGFARKGEEWEGVTKELVGKSKNGKPVYIGRDSDTIDEAQWLEPEDINRAYRDRIKDDSFVISFSGADLPDGVDSFISTGEIATKLNNKWEQYQLLSERKGILIPVTDRLDSGEEDAVKRKEALKNKVSLMRKATKCGKVVIKKLDLSGGYRMQVIAEDYDFENYCSSLSEEELSGQFLISEYIPHKQSLAGIGIVSNQNGKRKVHYCGTTEQVLYHELAYEGLIWPPFWNAESRKSVQKRKEAIEDITRKIGKLLADQGYFGFYNVDFVEEEKTGRMYAIEINARFGFSTLFYALYCGKERFFDAIQGKEPPVIEEDNSDGDRRLLGKIKGIPGKSYGGLFKLSDIEKWYDEKGGFRTYFLQDETFKYGSFAGLFGETIPKDLDRNTAIVKFMDICLLRGKRMISMYVDSYCGFEQECFNFDIIKKYQINKIGDTYSINLTKKPEAGLLNFWSISEGQRETRNITALSMMVGKNGSGKTTFMRLAIKWLSLLAIGIFPEETGVIVFGTGDGQDALIAFSGGHAESIHKSDNIKDINIVTDTGAIKKIFHDVGFLYYTDTSTDLELDREIKEYYKNITENKIFIDNSKVNQLNNELINNTFDLYPLRKAAAANRNLELRQTFRTWETFGKANLPFSNIKLCVKAISDVADYISIPEGEEKEIEDACKGLNDSIHDLVIKIKKNTSIADLSFDGLIKLRIISGLLSMTIKKIITKSKSTFFETVQNAKKLISDNMQMKSPSLNLMVEDAMELAGNYWTLNKDDLKKIIQHVSSLSADMNNNEVSYWVINSTNGQYLFHTLNLDYFQQNKESEKESERQFEKKWIELLRLSLENNIDNITDGNVYFDLGFPSSGESNKAGLYSSISQCGSWDKVNILSFLDEPDNSYHLEWKQEIVYDIIGKYNHFQDKTMQIFMSSHSPVILSDVPEDAQIIFERNIDCNGKIVKGQKKEFKSSFMQQLYNIGRESFDMKSMVGNFSIKTIQIVDEKITSIFEIILKGQGHLDDEMTKDLRASLESLKQIVYMVDEPLVGNVLRRRYNCCSNALKKVEKE